SPGTRIGPTSAQPGAEAPERPGASFRDKLEGPGASSPAQAGAAAAVANAANTRPIAELAEAVRAGALSSEQAIERRVERSIGGVAHGLSLAQRAELTQVLREALANDPALRELRDAIG